LTSDTGNESKCNRTPKLWSPSQFTLMDRCIDDSDRLKLAFPYILRGILDRLGPLSTSKAIMAQRLFRNTTKCVHLPYSRNCSSCGGNVTLCVRGVLFRVHYIACTVYWRFSHLQVLILDTKHEPHVLWCVPCIQGPRKNKINRSLLAPRAPLLGHNLGSCLVKPGGRSQLVSKL
jgi:hypothetical protein